LKKSKQTLEVKEFESQHDFVQNVRVERREGRTQETLTRMLTESNTNTGIGNIKTNLGSQGIRISA
jgi:arginine repressor